MHRRRVLFLHKHIMLSNILHGFRDCPLFHKYLSKDDYNGFAAWKDLPSWVERWHFALKHGTFIELNLFLTFIKMNVGEKRNLSEGHRRN